MHVDPLYPVSAGLVRGVNYHLLHKLPQDCRGQFGGLGVLLHDFQKTLNIDGLSELYPFPDHPFSVRDDDSMKETVESVKEYGVLMPAIARPREGGGYELVAGHRRKHACELAGLDTMPVIVRDLDRDTAIIFMVDSNLQRENILPSERAKAYKMKLDAIKRRAGRPTVEHGENSPKISANFRSDDEIGAEMGVSGDTVRNYIALTQLVPELQQMVDDRKIAMTPAYQIAALKPDEQALLVETINSEQATPSLSQAQRMKKLSQSGKLDEDTMLGIMSEEKKPEVDKIVLTSDTLHKYFPRSYTPKQMQDTIIKLLEQWMKKRQRRETDLPDLLTSLGYQVKRVGSYYTTKEMDSLRIKNRRTWFRYSENRGGDAISFLERFEGKSFPEAVEYLLDYHGGARFLRAPPPVPEKKEVPFALPPPNSDNRRVTAYLQKRCIAPQVIRDFIGAGLLYEDAKYHNCVFVGRNSAGKALIAEIRKGIKPGEPVEIGTYRGFSMALSVEDFGRTIVLTLKGQMSHRAELGDDVLGNLLRIDHALNKMPDRVTALHSQLDNLHQQMKEIQGEIGKPFPQEAELQQKSERLAELNAQLGIEDGPAPVGERLLAKDARPSVLEGLKRPVPPKQKTDKPKDYRQER